MTWAFAASALALAAFDSSRASFRGGHRLIVLLLRNFLLLDELLVAGQIVLRFDVVGFGLLQIRLGRVELLLRRFDARLGVDHVCVRR